MGGAPWLEIILGTCPAEKEITGFKIFQQSRES